MKILEANPETSPVIPPPADIKQSFLLKLFFNNISKILLTLIWFLFNYDNLMTFSYSDAINFFDNKLNIVLLSLIFILAFFHMRLGMGEIFEDSIHHAAIKKAVSTFILIISFIIPLVAITALLMFVF